MIKIRSSGSQSIIDVADSLVTRSMRVNFDQYLRTFGEKRLNHEPINIRGSDTVRRLGFQSFDNVFRGVSSRAQIIGRLDSPLVSFSHIASSLLTHGVWTKFCGQVGRKTSPPGVNQSALTTKPFSFHSVRKLKGDTTDRCFSHRIIHCRFQSSNRDWIRDGIRYDAESFSAHSESMRKHEKGRSILDLPCTLGSPELRP